MYAQLGACLPVHTRHRQLLVHGATDTHRAAPSVKFTNASTQGTLVNRGPAHWTSGGMQAQLGHHPNHTQNRYAQEQRAV